MLILPLTLRDDLKKSDWAPLEADVHALAEKAFGEQHLQVLTRTQSLALLKDALRPEPPISPAQWEGMDEESKSAHTSRSSARDALTGRTPEDIYEHCAEHEILSRCLLLLGARWSVETIVGQDPTGPYSFVVVQDRQTSPSTLVLKGSTLAALKGSLKTQGPAFLAALFAPPRPLMRPANPGPGSLLRVGHLSDAALGKCDTVLLASDMIRELFRSLLVSDRGINWDIVKTRVQEDAERQPELTKCAATYGPAYRSAPAVPPGAPVTRQALVEASTPSAEQCADIRERYVELHDLSKEQAIGPTPDIPASLATHQSAMMWRGVLEMCR